LRKLEDNRQQFQAIFDTMADGVIILDADHNILQVNSAASRWRVTGRPSSLLANHSRAFCQMGVKATRCAPSASLVSAASS
jgi:PAS domain-containing protein